MWARAAISDDQREQRLDLAKMEGDAESLIRTWRGS